MNCLTPVVLLLVLTVVSSFPSENIISETVKGVRLARATCDLGSVSIAGWSAGHALCASHCLAMRRGFRGGRCINGVCHCRR